MPNPIDGYVEPVRRARRTAARAVELVRSGELGPEEVDFCDLLFGQAKPEAKLAISDCSTMAAFSTTWSA